MTQGLEYVKQQQQQNPNFLEPSIRAKNCCDFSLDLC